MLQLDWLILNLNWKKLISTLTGITLGTQDYTPFYIRRNNDAFSWPEVRDWNRTMWPSLPRKRKLRTTIRKKRNNHLPVGRIITELFACSLARWVTIVFFISCVVRADSYDPECVKREKVGFWLSSILHRLFQLSLFVTCWVEHWRLTRLPGISSLCLSSRENV